MPRASISAEKAIQSLGIRNSFPSELIETLPFSLHDTTAGAENEFQAVVVGSSEHVDLRIFTIFHPGIFTIIHPPLGFAF